ncbi:MAG: DUF4386 domain-containing protein [Gammaproteobacteria bacterium]|nr:DUF4386 domain-containing protein [Gammaproteobacteria bacterium]
MNITNASRKYAVTTGLSYLVIFFAAIFANFFVVESLLNDPITMVQQSPAMVSAGIVAFLITVVFDVVVAWTLFELYKKNPLSILSTLFRMMHAVIMGVAIFSLPAVFGLDTADEILKKVDEFNTIWLIGLFFFGVHLIVLANIIDGPKFITVFLMIAGMMYMIDTVAHFTLLDYEAYADYFLMLVAIPSIFGEMSLAIWFLIRGGRQAMTTEPALTASERVEIALDVEKQSWL